MSIEQFDNVLSWAVDLEDEARQQAMYFDINQGE